MGKAEAIEALFAEARDAFGGIDILVCNAASGVFRNAMELDKRSWDWTMNINALSTLRCSQHAVPMMESRGGGRIVAVSSIGSLRTLPLYCGIGASKGAIETLARYLAVELAPRKIIVNCVAPGAVGTDEWKLYPEEGRNEILPQVPKRTPIGRMLTAEDVAKVVAFLCRFDLDAIVGQTITVDGGFSVYL
jgi:enoyl-[acyl-carrier protein] reductase III